MQSYKIAEVTKENKNKATLIEILFALVLTLVGILVMFRILLPHKVEITITGVHWVCNVTVYEAEYTAKGVQAVEKAKYQSFGEDRAVIPPEYTLVGKEYATQDIQYFIDFKKANGDTYFYAVSEDLFMEAPIGKTVTVYAQNNDVIRIREEAD